MLDNHRAGPRRSKRRRTILNGGKPLFTFLIVCLSALLPGAITEAGKNRADSDWLSRFNDRLAAYEYHARTNAHRLQAPNRAHDLRTYFESSGISIHSRTKSDQKLLNMSLKQYGREGKLTPARPGTVSHSENRVEIHRPGIVEWYKNSMHGLEQGFVLHEKTPGKGNLIIELAVTEAEASLKDQSIELTTETGRRIRYDKLVAFDAHSNTLGAHLEVPKLNRIRLVVDDSHATYPIVIDPLLTAVPDALLESNQPDPPGFTPAAFGASVAGVGDVNGDGFNDVAIGAPGWDAGSFHEGAIFVFLGSANGLIGSDPATAHAVIEGDQAGGELGVVAGAGDVNGDGYDDIVAGAHFYEGTIVDPEFGPLLVQGAVFVFLGSANGITSGTVANAHAKIQSDALSSNLGASVAGVDINQDGFSDIIIGSPNYGTPFPPNIPPNDRQGDAGAVLVFMGSNQGITGTGFGDADLVLTPYPPGQPEASSAQFGSAVRNAGDVNGDGFPDVIIGSPGYNGGSAIIFLGSAAGLVGTWAGDAHAVVSTDGTAPPGSAVSGAGDVNGDGFDDIIIGSPVFTHGEVGIVEEGAVMVIHGSSNGITATSVAEAQTRIEGNYLAEWLGLVVAPAGDVDNDGFDDIAFAARMYAGGLTSESVAYIFRGGPNGIIGNSLGDAYVRLPSGQSGSGVLTNKVAFGVSGVGDINDDGFDDIVVGHGYYDNGEENEGAAFVYHGGPAPQNPNQAPVPNAGPNQTIIDIDNDSLETVTLDGTGSFDPDGAIVEYAWLEGETLLGTGEVLTTTLGIGNHIIVLAVTDDNGLTMGDPVQVKVDLVPSEQLGGDDFSSGTFSDGFGSWTGPWTTSGNVAIDNNGAFSLPNHATLSQSPASLNRSIALGNGSTGLQLTFWGKASGFAPADQVFVKVSFDSGPFTIAETITADVPQNTYQAYNINVSWFPTTASEATIAFESAMSTGTFSIDNIVVRGLLAPTSNQNPVADAGPDQTVTDFDGDGSETVTLSGLNSTDPDGSIISFEWSEGGTSLGTGITLDVPLLVGTHNITLTVTDNAGATNSDAVQVTVNPNTPVTEGIVSISGPTAVSNGDDMSFTVTLSNTGNTTLTNAQLTFAISPSWRVRNVSPGSPQSMADVPPGGSVSQIWTAEARQAGNITVTAEALSNGNSLNIATHNVTIYDGPVPGNQAPNAAAGPDQTVTDSDESGSETVTLDGSGSQDPDGSIVSYDWSEGSTPLGTGSTLLQSFPVGTHTVTLTVTDNEGATDLDNVTITVLAPPPNQAPVADAGPDQTVVDADENGSETVTLNGQGSSDPDGSIVSYEWREGSIVLGTGATLDISFGVGFHTVTLIVTDDDGATNSDVVTVTVKPAAPSVQGEVTISGPTSVRRGRDVSYTVTFTNTGSSTLTNVVLTFDVNPDNRLQNVNPGSSVSVGDVLPGASVTQVWDAEGDRSGDATITVEALSNGVLVDTDALSITVTDRRR